MTPDAIEKTKGTRFKKGQLPHNTKSRDGVITIRHDHPDRNNGRSYKYIRVSLGKWVPYHRYLWEKKYGKIPSGHCLWFKDGNSLNCRPSNLELITRKENYDRNSARKNLSDRYVANAIAWRDPVLKEEVLKNPELIKLKRQQLILKRTIHDTKKNRSTAGANGK